MATVLNNNNNHPRQRVPPPRLASSPRIFTKHSNASIEQKMAELRAVYATPSTKMAKSIDPKTANRLLNSRAPSLPIQKTASATDIINSKNGPPRRTQSVTGHLPTPTIMDLATSAGLLSLSPSDLVFESSMLGIAYYDFVLSVSEVSTSADDRTETKKDKVYRLFLAKLDSQTNVEWFESVVVPSDLLAREGIPPGDLSLLTMGVLVWRARLHNARLLCLAGGALNNGDDNTVALEALKRAACKFKCMHHVLTLGARRQSAASTCSSASNRSSISSGSHGCNINQQQDTGMKLRILMCQSRSELSEVPAQALRETKMLFSPSSNPLLCLCFPRT